MVKNVPSRLIYAAQIRAARGLLNWSQGDGRACWCIEAIRHPHRDRPNGSALLDHDSIE